MSTISVLDQSELSKQRDSIGGAWATWLSVATFLAFASTYFQLFIFPSVPLVPWDDPVLFLENAKRILSGQLPYRDYLQFTTPGTELFYAFLVRMWHTRSWIPQITMVILAALIALIITSIAARLFSGLTKLAPALMLAGFVLPNSLYATHHWFSTVFVLGAASVLIDATTTRQAVVAGALCGLAGFFTQTKMAAVLLALIVFLLIEAIQDHSWRQFRSHLSALCFGAGATFLLANAYFMRTAGLNRFVFCTIIFPLRYYPAEPYNTWRVYGAAFTSHPGLPRLIGILFVHAAIPSTYAIWFLYRRKHPAENQRSRRIELLMAFVGIGMFAAIAGSPSLLRLCSASPPALVLITCILQGRPTRFVLRLAGELALVLCVAIPIITQLQWHGVLDTPSGRVAFFDPNRFEEFHWMLQRTSPGQPFFGHPPLSFALDLQNPTPVNYSTTSDFTRPSEATAIVQGLEQNQTPMIVLLPTEYLPSPEGWHSDHMVAFRKYLQAHYRLTERFASGDEVWTRMKSPELAD
jgi:hypothetical protein